MPVYPAEHQQLANSNWGLDLALFGRDLAGYEDFIETGTMHGWNAARASAHFPRVVSIELVPQVSQKAAQNFPNQNIRWLTGSSPEVLRLDVLATLDRPAAFWLDAHCSDPAHLPPGNHECPLLEELEAVLAHNRRTGEDHLILIDDARLFLAPPPPPHRSHHWPRINRIFNVLRQGWTDCYLAVMADVIVCASPTRGSMYDEFWRSNCHRFPLRK